MGKKRDLLKKPAFIAAAFLVAVILLPRSVFSVPDERASVRGEAIAKYADARFELASLYAEAGYIDNACAILSDIIYLVPNHTEAGELREKLSKEPGAPARTEKKPLDKSQLEKHRVNTNAIVLAEFPKVVVETVKEKRFTDAAYWIRFVCERGDIHGRGESLREERASTLAALKRSLAKLSRAGAHREVLSAARCLRDPAGNNDGIDRRVNAALKATSSGRAALKSEVAAAKAKHVKRKAGKLSYYLALPENYTGGGNSGSYPVIVTLNGAAAKYKSECVEWAKRARKRGYIVAVPITASNLRPHVVKKIHPRLSGNRVAYDHEGIMKMLADLENLFRADRERFFISGFSGGGIYAYFATIRSLGRWRASVPRNPNYCPFYWPRDDKWDPPPGGIYLPVRIFTSAGDEYRKKIVEPQTVQACAALYMLGYRCVLRTEVPDLKHDDDKEYCEEILDWFDKVVRGTQKSGKPPNFWP